jgi:pimeloyl-ACP methyl ester carboxylesterase
MVTLIARLNVEQVDWFGTSMGGLIGMGLAGLPKSPVRKLPQRCRPAHAALAERIGALVCRCASRRSRKAWLICRRSGASFGRHTPEQWRELNGAIASRCRAPRGWSGALRSGAGRAVQGNAAGGGAGGRAMLWQCSGATGPDAGGARRAVRPAAARPSPRWWRGKQVSTVEIPMSGMRRRLSIRRRSPSPGIFSGHLSNFQLKTAI